MKNEKRTHRLILADRQVIHSMRRDGKSMREISRFIGVNVSTISRELERNRAPIKLGLYKAMDKAQYADNVARQRLKERKRDKRGAILRPDVCDHIISELVDKKSPEAIAGSMEKTLGMRVSCATIYRWIKRNDPILQQYLFEKGKKRRQQVSSRRGRFQQAAAPKKSIHERPIEATNKSDLGHLEGDTIQGRKCTSAAIVSIRDRLSGVHFYERVSNLKADTTLKGMIKLLNRIPPKFRKTLTLDRGSEFAEWTELEKLFPGLKVYFCDPYCPYQKGGNERGNRDFRKYYPKGTNFDGVSNDDVVRVETKIRNHPMKRLKWQSPAEFAPALVAA